MKVKTLEQMTKAELIEIVRAKDQVIENANSSNAKLAEDLWKKGEKIIQLNKDLQRERAERDNYFNSFRDMMRITKALAYKLENS